MDEKKLNYWKTVIILILLAVAIGVTIDLAYIYYEANFNQYAMPSFCSISEFIDCDGVAKTTESQFLGVPLAYWGLFLYSFITMLLCVDKLKNIRIFKFLEVFKNKFHYIASLGLIAFALSMSLLCVSLFEIKKLCVMCAVTYVLNLAIGMVAAHGIEGGFIGAIKQSWRDFLDALKPLPYKIAFAIVMTCAAGFLYWTFTSAKFSPALKFSREYGEFVKATHNRYAVKGNTLGSKAEDAVVLHIYSDYMCPMCYACNIMLHKIVTEFSNLRIEHHSMPLDRECNKYLQQDFHFGSCIMAQYTEAAHMQDKFWEVNSLFFEKKPASKDAVEETLGKEIFLPAEKVIYLKIAEENIIKLLENSGFGLDIDKLKKDAHSKAVMDIINNDIDYAVSYKKIGTPAMKMGDDFEMGVQGYHELKKWVIKHGGKPKSMF